MGRSSGVENLLEVSGEVVELIAVQVEVLLHPRDVGIGLDRRISIINSMAWHNGEVRCWSGQCT